MNRDQQPLRPLPANTRANRTLASVIWLIPLLALLTGIWLFIQNIRNSGPEITLYLKNAEGIEVNNTLIRVLNVNVGRITQIRLRKDQQGVALTAKLTADAADLIRSDTQFWVVKPRIDQQGISGLNTLVSGAYIAFSPGTAEQEQDTFTVSELPPITALGQSGIRLRLSGSNTRMLEAGSPVIFENFPVGHIENARFDPQTRRVNYTIFINRPNNSLITKHSQFWLDSGIHINSTGSGIKLDAPPLPALISGAIAFSTPQHTPIEAAENNDQFELYNNRQSIDNLASERAFYYVVFFKQSLRGLSAGAPVEYKGIKVGSVDEIPYFAPGDSLKLFANGWIPVRLRIEPSIIERNQDRQNRSQWQTTFQAALKRGLHASLSSNNLLLGSKMIELSDRSGQSVFKPFARYNDNPVMAAVSNGGLPQLQKQITALLEKFNKLPLDKTVNELNRGLSQLHQILQSANELADSDAGRALIPEINQTLAQLRTTLNSIAPQSPLYQNTQHTLERLEKLLNEVRPLINTLQHKPNALIFESHTPDPTPKGIR